MQRDFKINNFDLIRIVTAVLVLTNHSLSHLNIEPYWWYTIIQKFPRVPMFFVMSGYLLSASFERNNDLKNYFTNRLLRIYPGLWACLILTVILLATIGGVNFLNIATIPWFVSQAAGLIYTPGFLQDFGYGSYNGSLWTIVVELQFYLALPVIYYLSTLFSKRFVKNEKTANLYFYILFGLSIALAMILKTSIPTETHTSAVAKAIKYTFLPHGYIFMTGILLQRWRVYKSDFVFGRGLDWATIYLLCVYLIPQTGIPWIEGLKEITGLMILAFFTISVAYSIPGLATKYLDNRDISYGVYMYHGLLLTILVEFNMTGSVGYYILTAVLTFVLAALSYKFIEMPAMSLAKKKNKARVKGKEPSAPKGHGSKEPQSLVLAKNHQAI